MKNLIVLSFIALSLFSCNQKSSNTESTTTTETQTTEATTTAVDTTTVKEPVGDLYCCPMHPEVQGKENAECSKCGMPLTEPVKK